MADRRSDARLATVTFQIAGAVNEIVLGRIFDADGAQKAFWTGVSINVAKVLDILAALITLQVIPQAVIGKNSAF